MQDFVSLPAATLTYINPLMKLHLPKMLRLAVLTCFAAIGPVASADTEYTWTTARKDNQGNYHGFAVALDSSCFTVSPYLSGQVESLYMDSLTLKTRTGGSNNSVCLAVYEYTAAGTTGTYIGMSSATEFAVDTDVTFEFEDALKLDLGTTYQFLFVEPGASEETLATYDGYKTADQAWGISVTATNDALSGTNMGLYTGETLQTLNRTFVGSISAYGYDVSTQLVSQNFTEVTTVPAGWTTGQWRDGWNLPHFTYSAEKGASPGVDWKRNSLQKAVTLQPTNKYQITFSTYSNVADKACIFYMSSDDYSVVMGQSYTSNAYVSVGYLESSVITREENESVAGARMPSFETNSEFAVPTLFDETAKSEGSALNNAASLTYEVILDGTYLSVTVTDGSATWSDEFTIRENVTFDTIGFVLDGAAGSVGIKDITIQETTYLGNLGDGSGVMWLGGEGEWENAAKWASGAVPEADGSVSFVLSADSQITLGSTPQKVGSLSVDTNPSSGENTTTLKEGELSVGAINLKSGKLVVDATAAVQTTALYGGEKAVLGGKVQIVPAMARSAAAGTYAGKYENATVEMNGGSQTLAAGAGLTLTGDAGTATLQYNQSTSMQQIATTGATVVLDRAAGATLTLEEASTMEGGKLEIRMTNEEMAAGTAVVTAGQELKLDGTTIVISTGTAVETTVLTELQDLIARTTITSADDLDVQFDSAVYSKYYSGATVKDGELRLVRNTSYYADHLKAETKTGAAGIAMADALLLAKNPQGTSPSGTAAKALDMLDSYVAGAADAREVEQLASALAGAGTSVLGMAVSGDVERQLKSIRNRTTCIGVDQSVVNDEMPYYNAWFSVEGDQQKLLEGDTADGYTLNSWGGTVGFDADLANTFTAGLALTAMYGDLSTTSADAASGDVNTYYVSAYARLALGAWTHTFVGTAGLADLSLQRTVAGDTIKGDTNAVSFGAMYEVGRVIALNEDATTCIQPVFNVAWRHTTMDAYTESNSDAALAVSEQTMDTVTFGMGARLQTITGQTAFNRDCIFECRAMVKVDVGDRSSTTEVELAGAKASIDSQERGAVGLEAGAGFVLPTGNDAGNIFLDASIDFRAEYTQANASFGYRVNF